MWQFRPTPLWTVHSIPIYSSGNQYFIGKRLINATSGLPLWYCSAAAVRISKNVKRKEKKRNKRKSSHLFNRTVNYVVRVSSCYGHCALDNPETIVSCRFANFHAVCTDAFNCRQKGIVFQVKCLFIKGSHFFHWRRHEIWCLVYRK